MQRKYTYPLLASALLATACAPILDETKPVTITPVVTPTAPVLHADEEFYQGAVKAIGSRDYSLALDYLQAARNNEPKDVRVVNAFGVVYDKLGRFDLSARYYGEAKALDPSSQIVAWNLTYSKVLQGISADRAPATGVAALAPVPPTGGVKAADETNQPPIAAPTTHVAVTTLDTPELRTKMEDTTLPAEKFLEARKLALAPAPAPTLPMPHAELAHDTPPSAHVVEQKPALAPSAVPALAMPHVELAAEMAPPRAPLIVAQKPVLAPTPVPALALPQVELANEPTPAPLFVMQKAAPMLAVAAAHMGAEVPTAVSLIRGGRKPEIVHVAKMIPAAAMARSTSRISVSYVLETPAQPRALPSVVRAVRMLPTAAALSASVPPLPHHPIVTGHPLAVVNATGRKDGADAMRFSLVSHGWSAPIWAARDGASQLHSMLYYSPRDLGAAQALASTLSWRVALVPRACNCGLELVVGQDIISRFAQVKSAKSKGHDHVPFKA